MTKCNHNYDEDLSEVEVLYMKFLEKNKDKSYTNQQIWEKHYAEYNISYEAASEALDNLAVQGYVKYQRSAYLIDS